MAPNLTMLKGLMWFKVCKHPSRTSKSFVSSRLVSMAGGCEDGFMTAVQQSGAGVGTKRPDYRRERATLLEKGVCYEYSVTPACHWPTC